jgi:hypothetical protein
MSAGVAILVNMSEIRPIDDETLAWSYATNCLIYEEDPGPPQLNVGSPGEPKMVPRREAWRELYSRLLIEGVDADEARLDTALSNCRERFAECPEGEIKPVWECAVDLCEQALAMVRGAGVRDDASRQRFLASVQHANTSDIFRPMPDVVEDSARGLIVKLNELEGN